MNAALIQLIGFIALAGTIVYLQMRQGVTTANQAATNVHKQVAEAYKEQNEQLKEQMQADRLAYKQQLDAMQIQLKAHTDQIFQLQGQLGEKDKKIVDLATQLRVTPELESFVKVLKEFTLASRMFMAEQRSDTKAIKKHFNIQNGNDDQTIVE